MPAALAEVLLALLGEIGEKAIRDIIDAIKPDHHAADLAALANAITAINAVLSRMDTIRAAIAAGDMDKAQTDLDKLSGGLATADKAADEALDKRFDTGDNNG